MLFRFALAVFKSTEEELLKCNDHMSIFNFLRQMPEKITDANTLSQVNIVCYYVAESASEQDKANPVFWLAPQAGKMGPCSPLGISRFDPTSNKGLFSHVINPLLTNSSVKMAEYWLVRFCLFIDLDFVQVNKNAAKRTWPISSHLDLTLVQ